MLKLRPYQEQSIDAWYLYRGEGGNNGLIVLPTGSGKSLVIANLCQEYLKEYPDFRICIVTHIRELIKQDYDELMTIWPDAPAGIYSAGMNRRDKDAQILFGGVQSMEPHLAEIGKFDLMIIDEAHLVPHASDTRYRRLIEGLRLLEPKMGVLGLTATAFRLDVGRLDRGDDALFDKVVHEVPVRLLIYDGYLCKLISKATVQQLDVSGVHTRGGEYIPHELELAVDQDWITRGACDEIVKYGADRKSWLVFCAGVKHATHVCQELVSRGIHAEVVLGTTPKAERDRMTHAFKFGLIQCLVSVNVVATGFNAKNCDMIALLRPTKSAGLFLQQVGRGLRNEEGKKDCLVLDFAGLVKRHGPIDTITADSVEKEGQREEGDKVKTCPQCQSMVPHGIMVCEDCGYQWPVKKRVPTHEAVADPNANILSLEDPTKPHWVTVSSMSCFMHQKYGGTSLTMRVDYLCGHKIFSEWICLEHTGYAREKAVHWWRKHGDEPVPWSVANAVDRRAELATPSEIRVWKQGQYWRIDGRKFAGSPGVKRQIGAGLR